MIFFENLSESIGVKEILIPTLKISTFWKNFQTFFKKFRKIFVKILRNWKYVVIERFEPWRNQSSTLPRKVGKRVHRIAASFSKWNECYKALPCWKVNGIQTIFRLRLVCFHTKHIFRVFGPSIRMSCHLPICAHATNGGTLNEFPRNLIRASLNIVDIFKYWLKSGNKNTKTLHKNLRFFTSVSRGSSGVAEYIFNGARNFGQKLWRIKKQVFFLP